MVTTARRRRTRRQQAPPPPKTGTGRHWGRGWRQHKGPLYDRNGNPLPKQTIWRKLRTRHRRSSKQAQRMVYKTRTRYTRRRVRRRGLTYALAGCLAGAMVLTWSVAEFGAWSLATDLFTLAELTSAGTAWWWSTHPPKGLGKQPPPPPAPRAKSKGTTPPKSGGHRCGAPTVDNTPCEMRVKAAGERCRFHPGGASKPTP